MSGTGVAVGVALLLALGNIVLLICLKRQQGEAARTTERLRQENEERRRAGALVKLQRDLAVTLGARSSLEESLNCVLDLLTTIPGVDAGGVYLVQEDGHLELAAHRNLSEPFVAAHSRVEAGEERTLKVMEGRVFTQDYNTLVKEALLEGIRSVLSVPVLYQSRIVAVLNMASRTVSEFQPPMITAIEAAAEHIGGIVARIRAQEALKEREACFRNLAECSFDGIGVAGEDGSLMYVNHRLADLAGVPAPDLIGRSFETILHPDQREIVRGRFSGRLRGEAMPTQYCSLLQRPDGTTVSVRGAVRRIAWHGKPAVLAYLQSLEEHEKAERILHEVKANLDTLFEFAPVPLLLLDDKTQVVLVNVSGQLLACGDEVRDILAKRPGEVLHCAHHQDSVDGCGYGPHCPVCELRRGLETVLSVEGSVRGEEVTVELNRNGGKAPVRLRMSAEPVVRHDRRHILVALEELGEKG